MQRPFSSFSETRAPSPPPVHAALYFSPMHLPRLLLAILLTATPPPIFAQVPEPPTTPPPITFEVTSVKPSKAGTTDSRSSMNNARFTASNITLKNLMAYTAFGVPEPRIFGGPAWLNTARFDIEARLDAATYERWNHLDHHGHSLAGQSMFQQLLADRFHLRYHWETRTLPVYALVVARSGSRLSPSTQADADTDTNDGEITAKGVTVADLARTLTQELSHELGRVVTDHTGLPGKYNLTLTWTPADTARSPDAGASGSLPDPGPSIFTALREQLGLKLEATRGPVQVLVIDQLDPPAAD